jgi:hypothetical protein
LDDDYIIPGGVYMICDQLSNRTFPESSKYKFTIFDDSNDSITLLDYNQQLIATTTGIIPNGGNATLTYQRTTNNTYMFGIPTHGDRENFPIFGGPIYINEVASSATPNYGDCNNNDWIELINTGNTNVNLNGLILHDDQGLTSVDVYMISNVPIYYYQDGFM